MICWILDTFGIFWTLVIIYVGSRIIYSVAKNNGYLPKKNLKGEHVFITGAGSGIGRQIAILLSKMDAKVTIVDINLVGANETAELIKKEGGECLAIKGDVSDVEMISKAATQARNEFGDVTILINNAGIVSGKSILETSHKEAELILKVNTLSHIYTTKEFLPSMIKNNRGHIVTVASSAGLAGAPKLGAYCLSKFALLGFEEALRLELKRQKLNINTTGVCPTLINTGMFKGAGPKYEWLMPPLDEKWISERIVLAIRQNEPLLLTPFISGTIYLTRTLLPTYFLDKYLEFIGVYEYMDGFVGRGKD